MFSKYTSLLSRKLFATNLTSALVTAKASTGAPSLYTLPIPGIAGVKADEKTVCCKPADLLISAPGEYYFVNSSPVT